MRMYQTHAWTYRTGRIKCNPATGSCHDKASWGGWNLLQQVAPCVACDFQSQGQRKGEVRQVAWYTGDVRIRAMGKPGSRYLLHIAQGDPQTTVLLGIPAGTDRARWLSPANCHTVRDEACEHMGGYLTLRTPLFAEDIALHLERIS